MIDNKIFFSVVIPAYNRGHMILETVESVLKQEYMHFEIIIVDDASTDNTEEVIKTIADKRVSYIRKPHGERAAARNKGFALSKGNYVTLLDSDDFLYPNHLSYAAEFISQHPKAEFIRFSYDIVNKSTGEVNPCKLPDNLNTKIVSGNYLGCSGIFLSRDIIKKYSFNEDMELSGSEDYEFWLRLAARYPIFTSEKITSSLNAHEERSVLTNIQEETLIKRIELLIHYAYSDEAVLDKYGRYKNSFTAKCLLYVSLHLAIAKYKMKSLKYLCLAVKKYPLIISDIRILGIVKTLLLK